MRECNFNKAIGPDGFDGLILERNPDIKERLAREIMNALNTNQVEEHLKIARLVPISKNKGSEIARENEIRPIAVKSHIFKIMERAVMNKIKDTKSKLLESGRYQNGFKEGRATANNLQVIVKEINKGKRQAANKAQYITLVDI